MLLLLVAVGAAGVYLVLVMGRWGGDPDTAELLRRLPMRRALTIHVDLTALRKTGLDELLLGSKVAEEPEYQRFVAESGFDWKRDLDAVTACKRGNDWYFFVRGRFDMDKLRNYALSRGGTCRNGVCEAYGATPGRRVSFYPLTNRLLAVASSTTVGAVYTLQTKGQPDWAGGVPEGPVWVSFTGDVAAGDPQLPAGGRLFGKVLAETERTTFSATAGAAGLALTMRAHCANPIVAGNVKSQLEGVTKEFKDYFARVGQPVSNADLSGLLLAGEFAVEGSDVRGKWPLHMELLKQLAGGGL